MIQWRAIFTNYISRGRQTYQMREFFENKSTIAWLNDYGYRIDWDAFNAFARRA